MSQTVEERVVEFKFDNRNFESNVKTSMATLEELKTALNMEGVKQGLEDIEKAAKGIDFSGISAGIDALNEKFTAIGIAGKRIISNMVDDAYNFVKQKVLAIPNFITEGIVQGGIRRAMNIETAKFQLEGLKVAWDDIKDDIDYAVSGTAYGLDQAAVAASQLVASGIEFGETFGDTGNSPMAKALRGISGVAAMTNRDYGEISRIFTTVAGNGRMMGDQLNQLGERGINAAATIKDFFNDYIDGTADVSKVSDKTLASMAHALAEFGATAEITEQDIREMTSKGLISFEIFSEAMDNAFGEHAKDANRTFTGALSNIKAALSRIGADFVTPLITTDSKVVKLLNSIRTKFNEFRSSITSKIAPAVTSAILEIANKLSKFIDAIKFKDLDTKEVGEFVASLRNILIGLGNIIKGILSPIQILRDAFKEIFGEFSIGTNTILKITASFRELTEKFRLSEKHTEQLKNAFKGLFSIIDSIGRILGVLLQIAFKLLSIVLKPLFSALGTFLSFIGNKVFDVLDIVGKFLLKINEWVRANVTFANAVEFGKKVLGAFLSVIALVSGAFKNIVSIISTKVTPVLTTVGEAFKAAKQWISDTFTIPPGLKKFGDTIKSVFNFLGKKTEQVFGVNFVSEFIERFSDFSTNLKGIWESLKSVFKGLGRVFTTFANSGDMASAFNYLKDSLSLLKTYFYGAFNYVKGLLSEAFGPIKEFFSSVFVAPDLSGVQSFKEKALTAFDSISTSIGNTIISFRDFSKEKIKVPDISGIEKFKSILVAIGNAIRKAFSTVINFVKNFAKDLVDSIDFSKIEAIKDRISNALKGIVDAVKGFFAGMKESFSKRSLLPDESNLEGFSDSFVSVVQKIISTVKELFKDVNIIDLIDTLLHLGIFKSLSGILKSIDSILNPGKNTKLPGILQTIIDAFKSITDIKDKVRSVLDSVRKSVNTFATSIKISIVQKVAIALAILTASILVLSLIPGPELAKALAGMTVMFAELAVLMSLANKNAELTKGKGSKMQALSKDLIAISLALRIMASVVKTLSDLSWGELAVGLTGLGAIMAALVGFMTAVSKLKIKPIDPKKASSLITTAAALLIMAGVIKLMGSMEWTE